MQSPSKQIDLSLLTIEELDQLHFDEEIYTVEKIRLTAPFSEDRHVLLKKGYENVIMIMDEKALRHGKPADAFGANKEQCRLVKKMIHKVRRQTKKNKIVFYEMGVGRGLVVNSLLEENGIYIRGCDVFLEKQLKDNPKFDFYEGTIFDALSKVDDASIDVFYSNDVLEHLLDDEINEYINLIYRKIADNGVIITFTPNRRVGPSDITRLFFPSGTKPKGFHFHEYSYFEVKKLFISHGFRSHSYILMNLCKHYIICCRCMGWLIELLRFIAESLSPWIYPIRLRRIYLYILGCQATIFGKYGNAYH